MPDEPNAQTTEPADLVEAALGVTPEQLQRYEDVIARFLRGEYFSLDPHGKVMSWTRAAEQRFGWAASETTGEDFAEMLAVPEAEESMRTVLGPVVTGEEREGEPAGARTVFASRRRDGDHMSTDIALVPIRRGDGYHLNLALQDITTHRGNPVEHHRMKKRHADVLRLIITALDGGEMPNPLGDDGFRPGGERIEERWTAAGALVIFDGSPYEVAVATPEVEAAPVVAAASAAAGSSARVSGSEVERLRRENDELRREVDKLRASAPGTIVLEDVDDDSVSQEDIEQALREDGFQIHGQPVLDLGSDEVTQHELLLRMVDSEGGLVMPQAFFSTARRTGLTTQIDQWVVRRAVRTIAEQAQVGRDIRLEVNLSAESLDDAMVLATIDREINSTGIDPARLILEIPERVAIEEPDRASKLAKRLRAMGCSFALDDFGTSFGSFRFLKDLPVDFLKIDGDLIVTLSESRTAQLVVKALVDVAKGTGAQTIAVFASDDEALRMLREIGVGYAQGHKVGRPRPIAEALSAVEPAPPLRAVDGDQAAGGTANLAT
jgi:PAS domain S-box-containing protein